MELCNLCNTQQPMMYFLRLNVITGANGANGTVYAGESETFAKIISFTTGSPNNPDWFQGALIFPSCKNYCKILLHSHNEVVAKNYQS